MAQATAERRAERCKGDTVEDYLFVCPGSFSRECGVHFVQVRTRKLTFGHCEQPGCGVTSRIDPYQMFSLRLPSEGGLLVHRDHAPALGVALEAIRQAMFTQDLDTRGNPLGVALDALSRAAALVAASGG
ncbi:MAG: hypothetical protein Q8R92_03520 [Deltaproteobacteria bacterium]|nr:hypothetical protein [Deltaproteobacteria bacterium]